MNFIKTLFVLPIVLIATSCNSTDSRFAIEHSKDNLSTITITNPSKYLLLPIQESSRQGVVKLENADESDTYMDIRLATDSVDYYVPFELGESNDMATVTIKGVSNKAVCWENMKLSDSFDTTNRDPFRPIYHHTPQYGWMNDANGLVYKDGEYHLFFQYNPYGSMWGNMHWGHSVSKDLIHWEHLAPAIDRDTMGQIFSGSAVVDKFNSSNFGKEALVAIYTSSSNKNGQIQCLAYSNDNGRTFTKYENNPVLKPFDGLRDFRDPKVFWYERESKWIMVVAASKEMRFYSSLNLKDWEYMSAFGDGYGVQPSQYECPDFVELAVDGDPNNKKWVLIANINPGSMFGGSATQYFIGDFDGTKFTCDTKPEVIKWMDYGKDHYATVCFSNVEDRAIAVPWMSNWQYANSVPSKQFRSANSLPRELGLFSQGDDIYMSSDVVKESELLRDSESDFDDVAIKTEDTIDELVKNNDGAYELNMIVDVKNSKKVGFDLCNDLDEKLSIYFDMTKNIVVMDRTDSGITNMGESKSYNETIKKNAINFENYFALATWAPLSLCADKEYEVRLFVDKSSIELFIDGGRIAMTNLIFPNKPYDSVRFYSDGVNQAEVEDIKSYKLTY